MGAAQATAAEFETGDPVDVLVATTEGPRWKPGVVQGGAAPAERVRVRLAGDTFTRICHVSSIRAKQRVSA